MKMKSFIIEMGTKEIIVLQIFRFVQGASITGFIKGNLTEVALEEKGDIIMMIGRVKR